MDVIFMGTPDFAVPTLDYLIKDGYNIKCVVTQPDRPKGRGNRMTLSPVKEKAIEHNIPVLQPVSIRKDIECIEKLKEYNPDVIVVVAFGQILPAEVLSIPKVGCINVHASLLPRLRGSAPINWSIINGDKETGITTMFMDKGVDTGDMLLKAAVEIGDEETAGGLHDRLMVLGAELLIKTLKCLENDSLERIPQDSSLSTYAPMLNKDTGKINWNNKSMEIRNLVRGTNPYPGAYSFLNGMRLKIWKADVDKNVNKPYAPGLVYDVNKDGIHLYTGDGGIIIKEVQPENGRKIDAYSYTLGHAVNRGDKFE